MDFTNIRARRDGTFTLKWGAVDRPLIERLIAELRELVTTDDPATTRLFPSAYGNDTEKNAGWDALAKGELIESRLAAIEVTEQLLGRNRATADEVNALMRSVNDVRLALGSKLDVGEEGVPADFEDLDDEDRFAYAVYEVLGRLVYNIVRALSSTL